MKKNLNAAFTTMGASNHSKKERISEDYYATPSLAVDCLIEEGGAVISDTVWEPACGEGHISKILEGYGHTVLSTDLIDRGFGTGGIDFLNCQKMPVDGDIITNPPYELAEKFVSHSLDILPEGRKCFMLLRLLFLEGKRRKKSIFNRKDLKAVYVFSGRIACAPNGDFSDTSKAVAYAWFEFQKGCDVDPVIKWVY